MIIRCSDDLYNGHWCPVCGTCRCYERGQFGGKQWTPKPKTNCPLHGRQHKHGNSKLIDFRFTTGGKERPNPLDEGWDDLGLGSKGW